MWNLQNCEKVSKFLQEEMALEKGTEIGHLKYGEFMR